MKYREQKILDKLGKAGLKYNNIAEIQSRLVKFACELRKNPTPAERILITALDKTTIRYRFQSVRWKAGNLRIFDFYFPKRMLAVELDGKGHDMEKDLFKDACFMRDRKRITILRFPNEDIYNSGNVERIIEMIYRWQ